MLFFVKQECVCSIFPLVFVAGIVTCISTVANCISAPSLICSQAALTTIYLSINFPQVEEELDRVSRIVAYHKGVANILN